MSRKPRAEGEPSRAEGEPSRVEPPKPYFFLPPLRVTVDLLSMDSIEGHNQVSGKGFPTTGPRIEAGNVVIHRGLHVRVQRGADRREAGRMRKGHMDASGFLYASADTQPAKSSVCPIHSTSLPSARCVHCRSQVATISSVCVLCSSLLACRCCLFDLCIVSVVACDPLRLFHLHVVFVVARKPPPSLLPSARCGRLCVVFIFYLPILFVVSPLHSSTTIQKPPPPFMPFFSPIRHHQQVAYEIGMGNVEISDNLRWIAHGPHHFVIKYNSYTINGCRFHTESYDKKNLEMEKMNVTTKVVKEEVNVDVIILNDQQEDAIEVHNENKIVCDSNIKMPLPLKTILRFVENCPLQVGVVECGYYVLRYMRDIITNGSIVVTDSDCIVRRNRQSGIDIDMIRVIRRDHSQPDCLSKGKGKGKLASDREGSMTCHMGTQFCFCVYVSVF
uniref:Uncharacterized protein n=1 Tax=Cucumis melo TaxID=3656 RepID=A0A9I9ECX2_CUCME